MKILSSLKTGFARAVKSSKGIVIIWFCSLLLVSMLAIPMKSALVAGFGNSMITERLADGINVTVFADLGANMKSLASYFLSGFLMILFVGFLINSFFSAGLFNSLKGLSGPFSIAEFFRSSSKKFWSFIFISLIISIIVLFFAILIIGLPVFIANRSPESSEGSVLKTFIIMTSLFLMVLALILIVADYARAWQVSQDKNKCFTAIVFGFSLTFRTFIQSYFLMLISLTVQLLYGWLFIFIISRIKPATEGGIILLFLLSQLLFFIKVMLKAWRYGSVTRMMELETSSDILRTVFPDQLVQES